ncbi:MAG TPA: hypothetical protein VGC73_14500, partial [Pyrinomonadaceae bacterium]
QGDDPLVIKGWIGEDNSFIGNLGVTLEGAQQGSNAVKLNIYRSDLRIVGGSEMIGRQSVVVTGDANLMPNATVTYQVKINGVREAGEYSGKIDLVLGEQARSTAKSVKVTVIASVRPSLTLMAENDRLRANLVDCKYDCWLAKILLPASAFQEKLDLTFEKPLAAPVAINDIAILVKGDQTGFKLGADKLIISPNELRESPPPAAKNQPSPQSAGTPAPSGNPSPTNKKYYILPIKIERKEIAADHYTGSVYLPVAGQSNVIKVPVDFNVRSGPFWPLVMLLVSILLGRLFKFMQDKGNAIADALQLINRLEFRLRDANPDDAAIIKPMLGAARDLVHQEKAAEAVTAANAISARLSALGELRQIQVRLEGMQPTEPIKAILTDINQARETIQLQQDDKTKTLITKIKDALEELAKTPGVVDTDDTDLKDAIKKADSASASMAVLGTGRKVRHRLRDALVVLSGLSDEFRTEATLFLARPILWLALLIGLLALGLKTVYVDNPVFGANAFTDFLGLMFWGLSSDVASRTLSGLRLNNPNRPAGV